MLAIRRHDDRRQVGIGKRRGESGVIDMLGVAGYFTTVSMIMNVAHSPPPEDKSVAALLPFPF